MPGQDLGQVRRVVVRRLGQAAQRHAALGHQPPDLGAEVRHSRVPIPPGVDLWTALRVTTGQQVRATPGKGLTAGIRETGIRDREARAVVRYREDTPGKLAQARARPGTRTVRPQRLPRRTGRTAVRGAAEASDTGRSWTSSPTAEQTNGQGGLRRWHGEGWSAAGSPG